MSFDTVDLCNELMDIARLSEDELETYEIEFVEISVSRLHLYGLRGGSPNERFSQEAIEFLRKNKIKKVYALADVNTCNLEAFALCTDLDTGYEFADLIIEKINVRPETSLIDETLTVFEVE